MIPKYRYFLAIFFLLHKGVEKQTLIMYVILRSLSDCVFLFMEKVRSRVEK